MGYRRIKYLSPLEIEAKYTKERNNYIKGEGMKALKEVFGKIELRPFFDGKYLNEENEMIEGENGILESNIVNYKTERLPKTGSIKRLLCLIGGIIMIGTGLYVGKKKKN